MIRPDPHPHPHSERERPFAGRPFGPHGARCGRAWGAWLASLALVLALGAGCAESRSERLAEIRAGIEAGQSMEAVQDLRAFLADYPDDPEANFLLGSALSASRQFSRAMIPLQKALEAEEYRRHAAVLLTAAFLNTSNLEGALDVANRLVELDPEEPAGWHLRARARMALKRREEALEDTERLVALTPDDPAALELRASILLGLGRLEEGRALLAQVQEVAAARGDVTTAARSCGLRALAPLHFDADPGTQGGQEGEAGGRPSPQELDPAPLEACLAQYPTDATLLSDAANFYRARGELAEATALYETAVELAPERLDFRLALANQLWAQGETQRAHATLDAAVEDFATPQAYLARAELARSAGELEAALADAAQAAELAPEAVGIQYRRAELLAEAGRLEQARSVAESLGDPVRRELLRGQILLEQGRPAEALEALEKGLRNWPDNAQARALAGRAAQELLDVERALSHYRESVRADASVSNAGLVAGRLYHAQGRYADALRMFSEYAKTHPQDIGAFRLAVGAARAMGSEKELNAVLGAMEQGTPAARTAALAERVRIEHQQAGPEAALALARSRCELTAASCQEVLLTLASTWQAAGLSERALVHVERALEARPEAAALHDVRGRLLLDLGRNAAARAAFERALELEADFGPALAGLGAVALREGDPGRAVERFDQAAALDAGDAESRLRAAQILLAAGEVDEAEKRLRALLAMDPANAEAANDLAWILAEAGRDLDLALRLARGAAQSAAAQPTYLDTLAWVQIRRDEPEAAVETLSRALEMAPDDPTLHYRMALARLALDDHASARTNLEQALAGGSFPELSEARAALARLDDTETR